VDVLRHFTKLKCRLMPYLYGLACEAHARGIPTLRAMLLEFPNDPACDVLDRQYMLGDALLVAPVLRHDNGVDYYLPDGRWTHFFTNEVREGGRWQRETYDLLSLPLWVRPNTILPLGAIDSRPDYDFADGVTFHLFALEEGAAVSRTVPNLHGETSLTLYARREGSTLHFTAAGATKPWTVLLRGVTAVTTITGGTTEPHEHGLLLRPETAVAHLTVIVA